MTPPVVLVVDDEKVILESIRDYLKLSDYCVYIAEDGDSALGVLNNLTPDIIVSDIMMLGLDGYGFHQAVRQDHRFATIPFLFLTAKGTEADILKGTLEGVDAYITKPFEPETLLKVLETRLQRSADIKAQVEDEIAKTQAKLLNIFSHELRTPLTIIHGYFDLLSTEHVVHSPENLGQITGSLRERTSSLENLVQSLLL